MTTTLESTKRRQDSSFYSRAAPGALYLVLAFWVTHHMWLNIGNGYLTRSGQDQRMWEWFFAVVAKSVSQLQNPLTSDLMNSPLGVNLMANTAMLGWSIPMTPVTLLFGPTVTYVIGLTLGLAATAFSWFWLFSKLVTTHRWAAAIGGLFAGFSPGMISHANAHPNFTLLFLLPVIIVMVVRITKGTSTTRHTVVFGLVLAWQIMLGEEPLLILVMGMLIYGVVYYIGRRGEFVVAVKNCAKPFAIAAAIALILTIIPLYWQFFGTQSYRYLEHGSFGNDIESMLQFPPLSLGGYLFPMKSVGINPTEDNAYYGLPLLIIITFAAIWLWRNIFAVAAFVTVVLTCVLSLGSTLKIGKRDTGISLPWKLVEHLPLVESVLETRLALVAAPMIALIVVLTLNKLVDNSFHPVGVIIAAALAIAIVPLAPLPLPVVNKPTTPLFFTSGDWRNYVTDGSVVTVPVPAPPDATPMQWQMDENLEFPIAAGYFLGTDAPGSTKGRYGAMDRKTSSLLGAVHDGLPVPAVTDQLRADTLTDLEFWKADVIVLMPGQNADKLVPLVSQLVGKPGQFVDDVYVWDVRALVQAG